MEIVAKGLTFDDVLLVPNHSAVLPHEVNIRTRLTRNIALNIPLLSAAMDTVTEGRLAIALAQEGGLGVIHKNAPPQLQAEQVRMVKKFESGIVNQPITVKPDALVGDLLNLTDKHQISGVPVIDGDDNLVGIVTHRDWRFENDYNKPVSKIMTPKSKLVTVPEGARIEEVVSLLREHRLEKILMVDDKFKLKGLITVKDLQKAKDNPLASKDANGRLRAGAAVGTGADTYERVEALAEAGVDVLVVDTAHGHSQKVLEMITWIKNKYKDLDVIGGNIATKEAAVALVEAGADAVKVGIGPGSICTTRIIAGVGVPQLTAIHDVATALKGADIPVIADGGIRYSGDIAKAIAAGAQCVMIGSLLAGTDEAPGETILFKGRSYKAYRGMGSLGAMSSASGSKDRYMQSDVDNSKLVPEGIEGRVPYKGSMLNIVHQLMGGLRSSMGYLGAKDINTMMENAKFMQVSGATIRESHVHDVMITKEAPNYQIND